MNPPFSNPFPFVEKLCKEFELGNIDKAIVLLKVGTLNNKKTGALIQRHAAAVCIWRAPRIGFISGATGEHRTNADFDCCLVYFGKDLKLFESAFGPWGTVLPLKASQSEFDAEGDLPELGAQGTEETLSRELQKSDRAGLLEALREGAIVKRAHQILEVENFVKWLKSNGLRKTWAYGRMVLASAYERIRDRAPGLTERALSLFNQSTFKKFAQSSSEFQDWLLASIENSSEALKRFAPSGKINNPAFKKLWSCWTVKTSRAIPEELKKRLHPEELVAIAKISEQIEQLPESVAGHFASAIAEDNLGLDELKNIAASAKKANQFAEKAELLQCMAEGSASSVLEEALQGNFEGLLAEVAIAEANAEKLLAQFWAERKRLLELSDRLYGKTEARMPQARVFLEKIERNLRNKCSIALGSGEELSLYFNPPAQPAPEAESESLLEISQQIKQLQSELPCMTNGTRVKVSPEANRFPGAFATVVDDSDQERVRVTIEGNNIEIDLSASELAYKPQGGKATAISVKHQIKQLQRAIQLAAFGTSQVAGTEAIEQANVLELANWESQLAEAEDANAEMHNKIDALQSTCEILEEKNGRLILKNGELEEDAVELRNQIYELSERKKEESHQGSGVAIPEFVEFCVLHNTRKVEWGAGQQVTPDGKDYLRAIGEIENIDFEAGEATVNWLRGGGDRVINLQSLSAVSPIKPSQAADSVLLSLTSVCEFLQIEAVAPLTFSFQGIQMAISRTQRAIEAALSDRHQVA